MKETYIDMSLEQINRMTVLELMQSLIDMKRMVDVVKSYDEFITLKTTIQNTQDRLAQKSYLFALPFKNII